MLQQKKANRAARKPPFFRRQVGFLAFPSSRSELGRQPCQRRGHGRGRASSEPAALGRVGFGTGGSGWGCLVAALGFSDYSLLITGMFLKKHSGY